MADFNRRLQSAGAEKDLVFFTRAQPPWLPAGESATLRNDLYVALEEAGQTSTVRGGYALKHQEFCVDGKSALSIGHYHHPLSEGIVDKKYAIVGSLLLRDAMQRSPLLYCLGMGGYDRPLPQMLVRLGWSHCLVPFYFRIVRPARFLKEMQAIRTSALRRFLFDLGANTGIGWASWKIFDFFQRFRSSRSGQYQVQTVSEFGDWADSLWETSKAAYSLTAVRSSEVLRTLYPARIEHLTRLRVQQNGADIGWAVIGEKRTDAKYGAMRVGSIVDCWASPENARAVIQAATKALEGLEVDLILSNQSHEAWCGAMKSAGFLESPSNFIFAASKKLAEMLQPFEEKKRRLHFTRADGDGLPRNF